MFEFEKMKQLRESCKLTRPQLAEKVGVTAGTIASWENGKSTPRVQYLMPLADALGTSMDDLLGINRERVLSLEGMPKELVDKIYALVNTFDEVKHRK